MMDIPASPGAPYGREKAERKREPGAGAGGERGGKGRVRGRGWQVGKEEHARVECQPEAGDRGARGCTGRRRSGERRHRMKEASRKV